MVVLGQMNPMEKSRQSLQEGLEWWERPPVRLGLPETFLPAVEGRETNMLGSEELGAEVGGGGWSCSACPGGTEESGQPWGMDFEWEGWAGRWEVLERDRQTRQS